MNLFELSNEVAVVIGGTGVLGGALAEGLAEAGAKVAVLGRNEERGQLLVSQGGGAEPLAFPRARMGNQGRAREHDHAGLFPGGTKPKVVVQRRRLADAAHEGDLGTHADEPIRRIERTGRRVYFFGE